MKEGASEETVTVSVKAKEDYPQKSRVEQENEEWADVVSWISPHCVSHEYGV